MTLSSTLLLTGTGCNFLWKCSVDSRFLYVVPSYYYWLLLLVTIRCSQASVNFIFNRSHGKFWLTIFTCCLQYVL